MGRQTFTLIDKETGEELGDQVAIVRPRSKSSFERHFTMNQDTLITLAKELNGEQLKVLLALLTNLDYENFIQVAQVSVAENLGMQKTHVNRAIKKLVELEVIIEGPKISRSKSYRLNPNFGWKGTAKNHQRELKKRMESSNMRGLV